MTTFRVVPLAVALCGMAAARVWQGTLPGSTGAPHKFYGRLSGNGYDADDKRNNDGWSHGRPPHPSFPAQLVE